MKKKVIVISLGGSLIIPDKINHKFLHNFKTILRKNFKTHKFVIVTGGGSIARKYITSLREEGKSSKELALAGIMATRMNARFVMEFFGKDANQTLPTSMSDIKSNLSKNSVVICGALRFAPNSTSDGTSAKLANYLEAESFINMTNVKGLYSANPKTHPKAKFISYESWKNFEKRALKLSFKAGQHFVLDQQAAIIIRKHKIPTYIISKAENINKILKKKKFTGTFVGTLISKNPKFIQNQTQKKK